MKIIPENEVDEAAKKHCKTDVFLTQVTKNKTWDKTDWGVGNYKGFKAGVEFAKSKFEELAIEFLNWYKFIDYEKDYLGCTTKELFNQFLKERNKKE